MYVGAFGPITWDVLLLCALNYPNDPSEPKKSAMLSFINGLMYVLPCDACGLHGQLYVQTNPPDVSSSDALVDYIVKFHNFVNHESGKREYTVYEAKKALMERYFADGSEMTRAQAMRKEDHAKITELQKTLALDPGYSTKSSEVIDNILFLQIVSTIIMAVMFLCILALLLKKYLNIPVKKSYIDLSK